MTDHMPEQTSRPVTTSADWWSAVSGFHLPAENPGPDRVDGDVDMRTYAALRESALGLADDGSAADFAGASGITKGRGRVVSAEAFTELEHWRPAHATAESPVGARSHSSDFGEGYSSWQGRQQHNLADPVGPRPARTSTVIRPTGRRPH